MCPSYVATLDEKDSTRGRARVLQEAVTGGLPGGLADPAVAEALDLCLSCKGCVSDCPTGVDMAEYKSEVLHQTYAGKRRPRSHYALGRLPRWARLGAPVARLNNAALRVGPFALGRQGDGGCGQETVAADLRDTDIAEVVSRRSQSDLLDQRGRRRVGVGGHLHGVLPDRSGPGDHHLPRGRWAQGPGDRRAGPAAR